MNRQCIKDAVSTIADGCGLDCKKVEAWIRPLFNPKKDCRDAFSSVLEVITSNYHGLVSIKLDKEGHIVDMHIPGNVKPEQIEGLRNPRRR